jgi:hypothetical protein
MRGLEFLNESWKKPCEQTVEQFTQSSALGNLTSQLVTLGNTDLKLVRDFTKCSQHRLKSGC